MSLVAKAVFNELTIKEALELAQPDEIHVRTPYDQLYRFRYWSRGKGWLELFDDHHHARPVFSLPLGDKLDHRDGSFYVSGRDIQLFFYRLVPFTVAGLLSSEKLDSQGG